MKSVSLATSFSLLFCALACGGSDAPKRSGTRIVDLSEEAVISFKQGNSFAVSASKIDLALASKKLGRYELGESGGYQLIKEITLSDSQIATLKGMLQKVKVTSWGQCSDCSGGRNSIWMELPAVERYYFSYEGDCSCASESNPATLTYSDMNALHSELRQALQ